MSGDDGLRPRKTSVLARLLEELSWSGSTIRGYREGGRGFENVLTAEVFQALDYLPRERFMGEVVRGCRGADKARDAMLTEIEEARFTLLPGSHYLAPGGEAEGTGVAVQPDGLIEIGSVYAVLEAKRIRPSSFRPEQLAREYVLALSYCDDRLPLLLLVLGEEPPVKVAGHGRQGINDAIAMFLDSVLAGSHLNAVSADDVLASVDDAVCWITWREISDLVRAQQAALDIEDQSIAACVQRLTDSITNAVAWHS